MGTAAQTVSEFSVNHADLIRGDRLRFKEIWPRLKRASFKGHDIDFSFNTMGFAYDAEADVFSLYCTFEDGSDEVFLKRDDFLRELKRTTAGGSDAN